MIGCFIILLGLGACVNETLAFESLTLHGLTPGKRIGSSIIYFDDKIFLLGGRSLENLFMDVWICSLGGVWNSVLNRNWMRY
jgi:hypothetical protein